MQKLEELGIEDNTMVVFFSDNGGLVSRFDKIPLLAKSKLSVYAESDLRYVATSNAPLRGEKGSVYDGGIREPMIVKWPAKIKAGTKSKSLITSVDFYPTFVELAGGKLPMDQKIDGKSFVSLLDEQKLQEERAIFWHYPVYHHGVPASAIRKGDWKLIHNLVDNHTVLYNLSEDIGETRDLTQINPAKSAELLAELNAWRKDTGARFPIKNPDFEPTQREKWGKHPSRGK
ncbi:MAG: arylsulfatase A [Bacteroidia bacterium]